MTGQVVLLNERRFGFLLGADRVRYFFHQADLRGARFEDLYQGCAVTFDMEESPKGPRAVAVRLAAS